MVSRWRWRWPFSFAAAEQCLAEFCICLEQFCICLRCRETSMGHGESRITKFCHHDWMCCLWSSPKPVDWCSSCCKVGSPTTSAWASAPPWTFTVVDAYHQHHARHIANTIGAASIEESKLHSASIEKKSESIYGCSMNYCSNTVCRPVTMSGGIFC